MHYSKNFPDPARRFAQFAVFALALAWAGCQSPTQYADGPLPTSYVPQNYQAVAEGNKLIITFAQNPSDPIKGFNKWVVDGQLYLEPLHGTSTAAPPSRFEIDLSGEKLAPMWTANVFWAYNPGRYDPNDSAYWFRSERLPWVRQPVTVTVAPPAPAPAK